MNPMVLLLVLGGGAALAFAASSSSSQSGGQGSGGSGSGGAGGKVLWKGRTLVASSDCTNALNALPPAMVDKLVKSDLSDTIALGNEAEKLGLNKAASCLWAVAARVRIDALGEACDSRLLALPASTLKAVAASLQEARDADDLRAVASSLEGSGFKDAASCIRGRADAMEQHFKDEEKILGRKLISTSVCDQRLFELPDESFKKILKAIDSASATDLRTLAKGLAGMGFVEAAKCIEERASALPSPSSSSSLLGDGRYLPTMKDPRALPGVIVAPSASLSAAALAADVPEAYRAKVQAVIERLKLFPGNLDASGYSVGELLELASLLGDAPKAAAFIKDSADEINMIKHWPLITNGKGYYTRAKQVLSGFRRAQDAGGGDTFAESATAVAPHSVKAEIASLISEIIGAGDSALDGPVARLRGFLTDLSEGRERVLQSF